MFILEYFVICNISRYGFNETGYNLFGARRTIDNSFDFGRLRFDDEGLDWQGL